MEGVYHSQLLIVLLEYKLAIAETCQLNSRRNRMGDVNDQNPRFAAWLM